MVIIGLKADAEFQRSCQDLDVSEERLETVRPKIVNIEIGKGRVMRKLLIVLLLLCLGFPACSGAQEIDTKLFGAYQSVGLNTKEKLRKNHVKALYYCQI
jgi:hypothetical protein